MDNLFVESTKRSELIISTWNLCLGLPNKKDTVTRELKSCNIDVCALQETEIPMNFPDSILNCNDYVLELEDNNEKKRVGIYVRKGVNYVRKDLEKINTHIVIIDVLAETKIRIIKYIR